MNTYEVINNKFQIANFFFTVKDSEFELKLYKIDKKTKNKIYLSADEMLHVFCKEFDRLLINNQVEFIQLVDMPDGYTKMLVLKISKKDANTLLCQRQESSYKAREVEPSEEEAEE